MNYHLSHPRSRSEQIPFARGDLFRATESTLHSGLCRDVHISPFIIFYLHGMLICCDARCWSARFPSVNNERNVSSAGGSILHLDHRLSSLWPLHLFVAIFRQHLYGFVRRRRRQTRGLSFLLATLRALSLSLSLPPETASLSLSRLSRPKRKPEHPSLSSSDIPESTSHPFIQLPLFFVPQRRGAVPS